MSTCRKLATVCHCLAVREAYARCGISVSLLQICASNRDYAVINQHPFVRDQWIVRYNTFPKMWPLLNEHAKYSRAQPNDGSFDDAEES